MLKSELQSELDNIPSELGDIEIVVKYHKTFDYVYNRERNCITSIEDIEVDESADGQKVLCLTI